MDVMFGSAPLVQDNRSGRADRQLRADYSTNRLCKSRVQIWNTNMEYSSIAAQFAYIGYVAERATMTEGSKALTITVIAALALAPVVPIALAYDQEKVDLAGGLEEAMGHLWALELNLNEGNYDLVNTHALHPVTELYASMKPALAAADLAADAAIANALNSLADRTGPSVPLSDALAVVEETRSIIDYARNATIGPISEEANFKLIQMKMLLETSIVEYGVAVSGGQIVELAEFQDGLAFVVRSEQILDTIDAADIGYGTASYMKESLAAVQDAYYQNADPSEIESSTNRIIDAINGVLVLEYSPEKVDLAGGLEETMGHLWALELNLNEGNSDLANTHALHPANELYASMKPALAAADLTADAAMASAFDNLADRTGRNVPLAKALGAVEETRSIVEYVRTATIGPVSEEADFKLIQMKMLLETSIAEYGAAVSGGQIVEQAKFQDGLAFVVRSEQILDTIDTADVGSSAVLIMYEALAEVQGAYDKIEDPSEVGSLTNRVVDTINGILGIESEEVNLQTFIENIRSLLGDTSVELTAGNTDLARSYVAKAYLDNYEFLELPLLNAGEGDLMREMETMLRIDLQNLIRDGAPLASINEHIDDILDNLDAIENILN